jgi:hypothetical protein
MKMAARYVDLIQVVKIILLINSCLKLTWLKNITCLFILILNNRDYDYQK